MLTHPLGAPQEDTPRRLCRGRLRTEQTLRGSSTASGTEAAPGPTEASPLLRTHRLMSRALSPVVSCAVTLACALLCASCSEMALSLES